MADDEKFTAASEFMRSSNTAVDDATKLVLYGLYKQATIGPCNVSKPGFFDFVGKAKWESWKKLGDLAKDDAAQQYIEEVTKLSPGWEGEQPPSGDAVQAPKEKAMMGPVVSTLMHNDEPELRDEEKSCFDWCQDGNVEVVKQKLLSGTNPNSLDDSGLALLHWACDRGHLEMVKALLELKADINVKDGEGQTPLHYACTCGNTNIVRVLVDGGADVTIKDNDGLTPVDAADDNDIIKILEG